MKPLFQFAFFFAVLAAPTVVRADEQSIAAARAKAVAPHVNDMTVAVAHVDLSRVAVGPLVEMLARINPDVSDLQGGMKSKAAEQMDRIIQPIMQAGGKDLYVTVSLGGPGFIPTVLAILPLPATADEKALCAALSIPATAARRIGDALVIQGNGAERSHSYGAHLTPNDNWPVEIRASQRPELTAAFEAAGEGTAQAVLIPPSYTRRVIEELMPQLPKEIGGGPSSIVTRGVSWAAVGIDLPPNLALHFVVKSQDPQAAEALRGKWAELLRLAGQQKEVRTALPQFDQVAAMLTPKVEGDRLVFNVDNKANALVAAIEAPLGKARSASQRAQSMNNMKQLALAMFNFSDAYNHFPAAAGRGPDGKPLLSWRVYLLPFLDQNPLFQQFHLNEPWDSPHNKTLVEKMPAVFHSPKSRAGKGKTNYLVPVGNGALYASSQDEPNLKEIKDGLSNTIMMLEVDDQHAVIWTKPDDLAFDSKDPKKGIGSLYEGGFITAFCDGSVRFLSESIDSKTLAALFTRAGGEVIGPY